MSDRNWAKFTRDKVGRTAQLRISIQSGGRFSFNPAATRELLKSVKFVELFYDDRARLIGIKPVKAQSQDTYSVQFHPKYKTASISGKNFLNFYKIMPKKAVRFEPKVEMMEVSESIIVIDLNAPLNQA